MQHHIYYMKPCPPTDVATFFLFPRYEKHPTLMVNVFFNLEPADNEPKYADCEDERVAVKYGYSCREHLTYFRRIQHAFRTILPLINHAFDIPEKHPLLLFQPKDWHRFFPADNKDQGSSSEGSLVHQNRVSVAVNHNYRLELHLETLNEILSGDSTSASRTLRQPLDYEKILKDLSSYTALDPDNSKFMIGPIRLFT